MRRDLIIGILTAVLLLGGTAVIGEKLKPGAISAAEAAHEIEVLGAVAGT